MLKKKQQYYLSASRIVPQKQTIGKKLGNNNSCSHENIFNLTISKQIITNNTAATIIEQQRNKLGIYQLIFIKKDSIEISFHSIYCSFPILCQENKDRFIIAEQDFRKLIQQLRSLIKTQQSSDSSVEDPSFSQQISQVQDIIKLRGRPKGSRNKNKSQVQNSSEEEFYQNQNQKLEKRGRGRPKGAKNKKKSLYDDILHESNVTQLMVNMISDRSVEEFKLRIRKISIKEDKQVYNLKVEEQRDIRRGRGRPKGVRNKPKIRNEQSDSQQSIQIGKLQISNNYIASNYPICCKKCEQRQLKKAYLNRQHTEFNKLKNIAYNIGIENTMNLILIAIKENRQDDLRKFMKKKKQLQNQFIIPWDTYSRLQNASYTIRTKKQFISKNKRQGVNALIQDSFKINNNDVWWKILTIDKILMNMPNSKSCIELYEIIITDEPDLQNQINYNIPTLVRNGNQYLSTYLIDKMLKNDENSTIFGYSKQHLQCLSRSMTQLQFRKSSMLKQNCTQNFCSPIHCASINSNHELLSYILKHISQFNVGDSLNRKPIHYAALLQNHKNIQILLKHGADLKDIDKKKMTCLMLAAQHGRYKNIKFILDKVRDSQYINFKAQQGLSALHYAVIGKHQQCIALLLQDLLLDRYLQTKQGMNILHLAVGTGCQEIVTMLVDRGITPQPDYFHRTPLMIAIRNHHNKIFFYLLQNSGKFHRKDYSFNTLLHYAASYGNMEVIIYLLKVIEQSPNKKNIYPFEMAVLKGHYECAKLLQNWNYNYNQHLLSKICKQPRGSFEFIRMIKYLLQTGKYDINYKNPLMLGNTCLHFICNINEKDYLTLRVKQTTQIQQNQYELMQNQLISLLLQHGADRNVMNDLDQTALSLCIKNQNMIGIKLLLEEIPFEIQYDNSNNNHFIYYLTKIACKGSNEIKFVLKKLQQVNQKILNVQLKRTDWQGFEFIVYLIKQFTDSVHANFWKNYLYFQKQAQVSKSCDCIKQAILLAFREYQEHQRILIETVNFLVKIGSDPRTIIEQPKMHKEHENYKKWGIQHFLMKFPSLKLLKTFMKWIDTNFNMYNSEGRTPLHLFCMWNTEKSLFNSTEYLSMPQITYVEMKEYQGKVCLQYLLDQCCLNSNVIDINRSTPLLYAALNGQLGFVNLLRTFYSPINNVNLLNQVPLIEIIKIKDKFTLNQIESILIDENRAKPNFKDINQRNVLHHLVSNAKNFDTSPQICKKLFQYDVSINSLDKFYRSPIFYCFIRIQNQDNSMNNFINCNNTGYNGSIEQQNSSDKVEILQTLLNHEDIDLNIVDIYQRTPLHYACQKNYFFSILYLLDKHINYDIQDAQGNTPLAVCLKHRRLNQAALLIKNKVKYGHVIENGQKYSYFSYVIINKLSVGICFMLIDHGYPLQKALEEVQNEPFKRLLMKRYV